MNQLLSGYPGMGKTENVGWRNGKEEDPVHTMEERTEQEILWHPRKTEEKEFREELRLFPGQDWDAGILEQQDLERELRMLQGMYPPEAREILSCVIEACDRMEYEGSMMFDELPDLTMIRRISDGIWEQIRELYPEVPQEAPDEVLNMQYPEQTVHTHRHDPVYDLVQVLFWQEIYHRRCRYRKCHR